VGLVIDHGSFLLQRLYSNLSEESGPPRQYWLRRDWRDALCIIAHFGHMGDPQN